MVFRDHSLYLELDYPFILNSNVHNILILWSIHIIYKWQRNTYTQSLETAYLMYISGENA